MISSAGMRASAAAVRNSCIRCAAPSPPSFTASLARQVTSPVNPARRLPLRILISTASSFPEPTTHGFSSACSRRMARASAGIGSDPEVRLVELFPGGPVLCRPGREALIAEPKRGVVLPDWTNPARHGWNRRVPGRRLRCDVFQRGAQASDPVRFVEIRVRHPFLFRVEAVSFAPRRAYPLRMRIASSIATGCGSSSSTTQGASASVTARAT